MIAESVPAAGSDGLDDVVSRIDESFTALQEWPSRSPPRGSMRQGEADLEPEVDVGRREDRGDERAEE